MKELFFAFSIPNFENIQKELLEAIDHDYKEHTKPHRFTYQEKYIQEKCPLFMAWLTPRLKMPVRMYRYYVTPPRCNLNIHIDGYDPTVPFALNIPLTGTKGTFHSFYESSGDNRQFGISNSYIGRNLGATKPLDYSKCTKVADLELVSPHVTNSSVFHGITNDTDQYRVIFTVRWILHETIGRTVQECMEISDLLIKF